MNTPLQNDKVDDSDSDVELLSVSEVVKGWGGDQREKAKERRSPVVFKNKRGGGLTEVGACTQSTCFAYAYHIPRSPGYTYIHTRAGTPYERIGEVCQADPRRRVPPVRRWRSVSLSCVIVLCH
jgi:hypothetical protein